MNDDFDKRADDAMRDDEGTRGAVSEILDTSGQVRGLNGLAPHEEAGGFSDHARHHYARHKEARGQRGSRVAMGALVLVVLAAFLLPLLFREGKQPGIAFAADTATADMLQSPFKALYEQVNPSVVGIQVTSGMSIRGGRITAATEHAGSGVVISEDGYVVTNQHVVEGAEGVFVVQGDKTYRAEYVAGDASADVAVLRVEGKSLKPAKVGDSDALSVGDWAMVIGNPLGEQFANTLTVGVISGLGRDLSGDGSQGQRSGATNLIQTNAAINAGNSGGGLFNVAGELVGITSMKLSNNGYSGYASIEGIGLAIPMNTVKEIVADLVSYGKVRYPRVGVVMRDIQSPSLEPTQDMLPRSVWVTQVEKGSAADEAGMRVDDLIMEVDGVRVTSSYEVQNAVRAKKIGDTVSMRIYRIPGLTEITVDEDIPEGTYETIEVVLRAEE